MLAALTIRRRRLQQQRAIDDTAGGGDIGGQWHSFRASRLDPPPPHTSLSARRRGPRRSKALGGQLERCRSADSRRSPVTMAVRVIGRVCSPAEMSATGRKRKRVFRTCGLFRRSHTRRSLFLTRSPVRPGLYRAACASGWEHHPGRQRVSAGRSSSSCAALAGVGGRSGPRPPTLLTRRRQGGRPASPPTPPRRHARAVPDARVPGAAELGRHRADGGQSTSVRLVFLMSPGPEAEVRGLKIPAPPPPAERGRRRRSSLGPRARCRRAKVPHRRLSRRPAEADADRHRADSAGRPATDGHAGAPRFMPPQVCAGAGRPTTGR